MMHLQSIGSPLYGGKNSSTLKQPKSSLDLDNLHWLEPASNVV